MTELNLLWTIQLAPICALILIQLMPKSLKKMAPAISMFCALLALGASLRLISQHADGSSLPQQYVYRWLHVSASSLWPAANLRDYTLYVGFLVDQLNLHMILIVTSITLFVQMFSYYYMQKDPSRHRYFGFLSFFSFSMTGLVLSHNLFQTFLFWELVGLTSYLLIGFWYEKKSAATAARKAFVINRLADLGFYLGIILLFMITGTVNFMDLQADPLNAALSPELLTWIGILVFLGVMGKSAQFPFHVWLPDAMEGPTPVSALIHSATMVAAGVFLLARAYGLFSASETTLHLVLVIGSLTGFVGAMLATVQRDIKKIMAYSTVSQLGLMVMAMGAGHAVAGMFHLTTHAYFKSLLFLTSGAFIHRFHTNDIWEIAEQGGKNEKLPMFMLCLGLLSLSGIFPFAGFFSKDLILEALREHSLFFYGVALLVSFLTVYYSVRLLLIFFKTPIHHHGHHEAHHESGLLKICGSLPLITLAILSVLAGLNGSGLFHFKLLHWLGGHDTHLNLEILFTTIGVILAAGFLSFLQFKDPKAAKIQLESGKAFMQNVLDRKFFMDDLYVFFVKQIGLRFASLLNWFDRTFINNVLVNGTSYRILDLGKIASRLQSGLLQDYLSWVLLAGVLALFWVVRLGMRG